MDLFAALRRWMNSHASRKRVPTYLITALLVAMTALVPCGTLTAQAAGLSHNTQSAQLVPSASAPTTPSITLKPTKGPPKKPFAVEGKAFAPNAQVLLYFQGQLTASATTNSSGAFTARIIVPKDPGGQYTVSAQQQGGIQAQAVFTIDAAFTSLQPHKNSGVGPIDPLCIEDGYPPPEGQPLKLEADGEPANAPYQVWWQPQVGSQNLMASGTTTSNGTLSASFDVPDEPSENYTLAVSLASSILYAPYTSGVYSCINWNENGDGYLHFRWDGVGWDANSVTTFTFNGSPIKYGTTDSAGSFGELDFTYACPPPGTYPASIGGTAFLGQAQNWPINGGITVDSGCSQQQGSQEVQQMIKHT